MAKQHKRHVGRYVNSMQCHIHTHKNSTYPNIAHVEKNPNATWKQTLKNNANKK